MRAVSSLARTVDQSVSIRSNGGVDVSELVERDGVRPETVHLGEIYSKFPKYCFRHHPELLIRTPQMCLYIQVVVDPPSS